MRFDACCKAVEMCVDSIDWLVGRQQTSEPPNTISNTNFIKIELLSAQKGLVLHAFRVLLTITKVPLIPSCFSSTYAGVLGFAVVLGIVTEDVRSAVMEVRKHSSQVPAC